MKHDLMHIRLVTVPGSHFIVQASPINKRMQERFNKNDRKTLQLRGS